MTAFCRQAEWDSDRHGKIGETSDWVRAPINLVTIMCEVCTLCAYPKGKRDQNAHRRIIFAERNAQRKMEEKRKWLVSQVLTYLEKNVWRSD